MMLSSSILLTGHLVIKPYEEMPQSRAATHIYYVLLSINDQHKIIPNQIFEMPLSFIPTILGIKVCVPISRLFKLRNLFCLHGKRSNIQYSIY